MQYEPPIVVDGNRAYDKNGGYVRLTRNEALMLRYLLAKWPRHVSYDNLISWIYDLDEPADAMKSLRVIKSALSRKLSQVKVCVDCDVGLGYRLKSLDLSGKDEASLFCPGDKGSFQGEGG